MDQNNTFVAGIEPGGLRSSSEIKLLICYLVESVHTALSKDIISQSMQVYGLANYFEITSALDELVKLENLKQQNDLYSITPKGSMLAKTLSNDLPRSVREKAALAVFSLLTQIQNENENHVEILEQDSGYMVRCHISDGLGDMMQIELRVPDFNQAQLVKKNFHKRPSEIYEVLYAALLNDQQAIRRLTLEKE